MDITDMNPGDLVKIKKGARMGSYMSEVEDKIIPITCVKINDSFPGVIIKWTDSLGQTFTQTFMGSQLFFIKQWDKNNRRWSWIANRYNIGDCWSIYNAPIANNDRYKFMWQSWHNDGYYHCPFCERKLNSVEDIEEKFTLPIVECDCEGWKAREDKYLKYLAAKEYAKTISDEILRGTTELGPWGIAELPQ